MVDEYEQDFQPEEVDVNDQETPQVLKTIDTPQKTLLSQAPSEATHEEEAAHKPPVPALHKPPIGTKKSIPKRRSSISSATPGTERPAHKGLSGAQSNAHINHSFSSML